ncbi:MAG: OmpH family outer membrane protein [Acidobacteriota bacterium]|nr:OmpH family outer membrane protein [Acidobacteriota bacterium]
MKTFRSIAVSFVFAAIFAVSAFAQAQPAATTKIGIINTGAFDDKAGITKYVNAANSLEAEFKPVDAELRTMATKIETLQKEIQSLQTQATANPNVPIKPETVNAKVGDYEKMTREFKFKQEAAKADYERREAIVMGPIRQDIGKAMQEFAKQKGYSFIFDAANLDKAGLILAFDEKFNITTEFITFYNARPAGTATTATPK